jgi:hypothetical protein
MVMVIERLLLQGEEGSGLALMLASVLVVQQPG